MKAAISEAVRNPLQEQKARRNKQTKTYRHLVPVSTKLILPDGYREDLVHTLEPIKGLEIDANPAEGNVPEIVWLNPRKAKIYIDHNIQRELEASDLTILNEIGENFDWGQFKVPTLVEVKELKKLFCTDGQKTTLAAIHRNMSIPFCKTKETLETYIKRQAAGFIGINNNRTAIKASQLFSALYYRGDEREFALAGVLRKFGITPRNSNGGRIKKTAAPLETICINVLRKLYSTHDSEIFNIMCKIIAGVKYRPIRRVHLDALHIISYRVDLKTINVDRMINGILSIADEHAILRATEAARRMGVKSGIISAELANIYMANYKKPVSYTTVKPY